MKFHDGTDFDAESVKFNFDRMQNPETKSVRTGEIANVENAEVVDKYTVKLNLKRPDAALLATLTDRAGMIISPEAVKKFGADLQRNPVGTGPFQFVEWVKDDHLTLKRFDGYWDKAGGPYLDGIRYRPIPDDTVKTQSLIGGEIDVMDYVAPRDVAMLKGNTQRRRGGRRVAGDVQLPVEHDTRAVRQEGAAAGRRLRASTSRRSSRASGSSVGVAVQRPDRAIVVGVRQLDHADQARPGEGEAAPGEQAVKPNGFSFTVITNNIPINVQEAEAMKAQLAEAGITMERPARRFRPAGGRPERPQLRHDSATSGAAGRTLTATRSSSSRPSQAAA